MGSCAIYHLIAGDRRRYLLSVGHRVQIHHRHGATATTSMTHIAITESLDGKNVTWMEKVTDEQYDGH